MKLFGQNDPAVADYAEEVFKPEDALLLQVRENAKQFGMPDIHVGAMDGLHIETLTRAFNAKKAVELGTLAGYSGIRIARSLINGGKLYTFESSAKHAALAAENFKMSGLSEKIEILIGPALLNLHKIEAHGPFDLVFIDADKSNYSNYLQWAAKNLRIGGVVLADNTFAWGMISQKTFESHQDEKPVKALDAFNRALASDSRFLSTILPTGEGLTLGVKIKN